MAAALTPADRALAAGFAGQLEPAKKRQFVVTVIRGGQRHEWTEGYTSQQAAQDAGLDFLGTFHGVVSVRPLVELTEAEGARVKAKTDKVDLLRLGYIAAAAAPCRRRSHPLGIRK